MVVTIRRFAPHEWRLYRNLRLRALADSPDSFGSTYDREAAFADEFWEDRLAAAATARDQLPVVAIVDDVPVGLAWGRVSEKDATMANVYQVWVAPEFRGRRVGPRLIDAVIAWAREIGVRTLLLDVTANHPAAPRLYQSVGFVPDGEPGPLRPGSSILSQPMRLELGLATSDRWSGMPLTLWRGEHMLGTLLPYTPPRSQSSQRADKPPTLSAFLARAADAPRCDGVWQVAARIPDFGVQQHAIEPDIVAERYNRSKPTGSQASSGALHPVTAEKAAGVPVARQLTVRDDTGKVYLPLQISLQESRFEPQHLDNVQHEVPAEAIADGVVWNVFVVFASIDESPAMP